MNETAQMPWEIRWQQEIAWAEAARAAGNEGKARVCARRAAGVLAREYLLRRGIETPNPSAYDVLRQLQTRPELPEPAIGILMDLLVRVNPDYTLPVEADLIASARQLGEILLGMKDTS